MSQPARVQVAAIACVLLMIDGAVRAQSQSADDVATHLIQMQHVIARAIVAQDIPALDRMHAADFTYIDGTGRVRNKADTLRSYEVTRFRELIYDDLSVRLYRTLP